MNFLKKLTEALEAPDLPEKDEWRSDWEVVWTMAAGPYFISYETMRDAPFQANFFIDNMIWYNAPMEDQAEVARILGISTDDPDGRADRIYEALMDIMQKET